MDELLLFLLEGRQLFLAAVLRVFARGKGSVSHDLWLTWQRDRSRFEGQHSHQGSAQATSVKKIHRMSRCQKGELAFWIALRHLPQLLQQV